MFLLLSSLIASQERGITVEIQEFKISGDETENVIIGEIPSYERGKVITPKDTVEKDTVEWEIVDSISFYGRIPFGEKCIIRIDSILTFSHLPDTLTSTVRDAIESVPEWLRLALEDNFSQMAPGIRRTYAHLILTTPAPYTDEVAFQVAHIDPQILAHYAGNPSIFVENVQEIYRVDALLDFVELVEHPDYTTARFKISDHGLDTIEVEIPKERYYWDIVHPIISDEAPLFINPKTGAEASPPQGVFWRNHIFTHADTAARTVWDRGNPPTDTIHSGFISPILGEQLSGVGVLWDRKTDVIDNSAIGVITQWVQDVMVFNAGPVFGFERPIQPVRIYHIHVGMCGEWADLTAAAARASLIPTNSPLDICNDHIWNEWYDEEWRGWEPVNTFINSTHHYENWGWDIVSPFSFRGDGYIWEVTERYSEVCTLTVTVMDALGRPVDGARVLIASTMRGGGITVAGWHYTGSDGRANFIIGDNKPYWARIDSDIGYYPAPGYVTPIITSSVAGNHYSWSHNLDGVMPEIFFSPDTLPSEPDSIYKVEIEFWVSEEIIHGNTLFNNELGIESEFAKFVTGGDIEFFICDSLNHSFYQADLDFDAFVIGEDVDSGSVSFVIPGGGNWYIVFSNEDALSSSMVCSFTVRLFRNRDIGVEEEDPILATGQKFTLFQNFPNPFHAKTVISVQYAVGSEEKLLTPYSLLPTISIYDLSGRLIRTLPITEHRLPVTEVTWDGTDTYGNQVPSGVYFYGLDIEDGFQCIKKMVLLR